jgi:hypothetical protein
MIKLPANQRLENGGGDRDPGQFMTGVWQLPDGLL